MDSKDLALIVSGTTCMCTLYEHMHLIVIGSGFSFLFFFLSLMLQNMLLERNTIKFEWIPQTKINLVLSLFSPQYERKHEIGKKGEDLSPYHLMEGTSIVITRFS